jgi:hypothetical protein
MKERPILFSAPMVRALLAGTKTQTRRAVNPQPPSVEAVRGKAGIGFSMLSPRSGDGHWRVSGPVWAVRDLMGAEPQWRCPYGAAGERLWVRETWCSAYARGAWGTIFAADQSFVLGKRQHEKGPHFNAADRPPLQWHPSIFMPRWASRLMLEVTDVRVQRVQDITEEDAIAEGCAPQVYPGSWSVMRKDGSAYDCFVEPENPSHFAAVVYQPPRSWSTAREVFMRLWDSINGKRPGCAWSDNPWVWCVSFKRIDAQGGAR